jgi:hypothetical protein
VIYLSGGEGNKCHMSSLFYVNMSALDIIKKKLLSDEEMITNCSFQADKIVIDIFYLVSRESSRQSTSPPKRKIYWRNHRESRDQGRGNCFQEQKELVGN